MSCHSEYAISAWTYGFVLRCSVTHRTYEGACNEVVVERYDSVEKNCRVVVLVMTRKFQCSEAVNLCWCSHLQKQREEGWGFACLLTNEKSSMDISKTCCKCRSSSFTNTLILVDYVSHDSKMREGCILQKKKVQTAKVRRQDHPLLKYSIEKARTGKVQEATGQKRHVKPTCRWAMRREWRAICADVVCIG